MALRNQFIKSLQKLRQAKGLSQEDVARKIDVSLRTYHRIEQTGKTTSEILVKLAKIFGVDVAVLVTGIDVKVQPDGNTLNRIPVLNSIPASGFIESFEALADEWIFSSITNIPGLFALRVKGDSMLPEIKDGDIVIVSPESNFENNQIYAVIAGDSEHTLKTVRKVDGGYWLLPMNQIFEPIFVKDKEMIRLYRVHEILRRMKKK